jgi:multicomponent K+:H+ antiporter subunit E
MSALERVLPQPIVTLVIAGLWLVLAPAISLGNALLAAILGLAIPFATRRFWPGRLRIRRPIAGVVLFLRVMGDITVANWHVARLVLGPLAGLRPTFVRVPIDISDPFVATLLGSIVSLTPGTVSIDIDRQNGTLLVHGLDIEDQAALIASIKSRYEAPLKEIFGC